MESHKAEKSPSPHQHLPVRASPLWRHQMEESAPSSLSGSPWTLPSVGKAVSPVVRTRLPSTEAFEPDRKLLMDSNLRFVLPYFFSDSCKAEFRNTSAFSFPLD